MTQVWAQMSHLHLHTLLRAAGHTHHLSGEASRLTHCQVGLRSRLQSLPIPAATAV